MKRIDADTAIRMRQLELDKGQVSVGSSPDGMNEHSSTLFDVSKHISLVPVFREVESYFGAFERIAIALRWPPDVYKCKLSGRAQEACSSLSVEDSLVYEKVKGAILRVYGLVPEAYRQRFRNLKKPRARRLQIWQGRRGSCLTDVVLSVK